MLSTAEQTQAHFIQVFLLLSQLQEPFRKTGFLLGLLAPYTCASLGTSRLWAADCIACLLPIQDQSMGMDAAEEELRGIREELKASTPEVVLAASSRMAKVLGKYFPSSQTHEFMETLLNGMLRASPTCATAGGHWLLRIIEEHGEALLEEVKLKLRRISAFASCFSNAAFIRCGQ
ncbi:maestro heat-like repeat-containing protein family member 2B [Alligator mississippiensis]|uniref:maestro heat-like repeat-containing protein family member 2B n=1 Tax=Alligator mississippiensis TaxID=8496 RepID=UPI0028777135|nr:maestro heat-like repeat-containing protein family member 2B [Alligator mississippiensis]